MREARISSSQGRFSCVRLGRTGAAGLLLGLALGASPLEAANREHAQMMADIRMLQEQNQQLQVTLGTLLDALKTVSSRIDQQAETTRKAAADQKLLIDGVASEMRIVREKIDDTNVRLGTLSQEVDALRNSMPTMPAAPTMPPATPDGAAPSGETTPAAATPGAPNPAATPAMPAPVAPTSQGMSPQKLWDLAYSDYAAGQWALAIQGFETYLRAFPRNPQSNEAQFYIGEALQLDGKFKEAIVAFDKVINDFPQGNRVPDAYYKRGVMYSRLNQPDKARESFELVIGKYPDAEASRLAKQMLDRTPAARRDD
jgi:tol-pal system protein YbgF